MCSIDSTCRRTLKMRRMRSSPFIAGRHLDGVLIMLIVLFFCRKTTTNVSESLVDLLHNLTIKAVEVFSSDERRGQRNMIRKLPFNIFIILCPLLRPTGDCRNRGVTGMEWTVFARVIQLILIVNLFISLITTEFPDENTIIFLKKLFNQPTFASLAKLFSVALYVEK